LVRCYREGFAVPLYEYKCVKCGHRFEKIELVTASEVKKCPKCGARAERQIAAPAIQFKGSGWYVTDYAGKGSSATPKESSGDGGSAKSGEKAEKSGESKASESKSSESKSSSSDKSPKKKK
jgi:putative FmdB family regulatory protein